LQLPVYDAFLLPFSPIFATYYVLSVRMAIAPLGGPSIVGFINGTPVQAVDPYLIPASLLTHLPVMDVVLAVHHLGIQLKHKFHLSATRALPTSILPPGRRVGRTGGTLVAEQAAHGATTAPKDVVRRG